ncbi:MAG TPA: hypothetical protein VFV68_12855 [Agriterribacter sp.]|nr:hypothetical protein [Agriterribacter sp.]
MSTLFYGKMKSNIVRDGIVNGRLGRCAASVASCSTQSKGEITGHLDSGNTQ